MHENRTRYPPRKTRMYAQLQETPRKYGTVALIRLEKVRASQILQLRKKLKGQVEFVSIKDKLAVKALEGAQTPGVDRLVQDIGGQCMLLFTDMSPFRLNMILAKNKVMLAARGGDIASVDVEVAARNTGIAPGPMLTEFKEAGIPTRIDQGTIWIAKDTVPVRKGEVIGEKLASMLGKLDIKPIEASILLDTALEDGFKYGRDELVIDVERVAGSLAAAHQEAVNLSVEASYATADNIVQILAKASSSARSLSVESGYVTAETRDEVLAAAHSRAMALAERAGYTPS
ncbi:MAG: 50S ribosomal protein L10 [Thaumarchaeota archaeon]|nr:50S ribosomal protein L10 [Nitrososphaerota archaeon]